MHIRELNLLRQKFFGGIGSIVGKSRGFVFFNVNSIKNLSIIIAYFVNFPLYQYNIFVIIYEICCSKNHLTIEGFIRCVS